MGAVGALYGVGMGLTFQVAMNVYELTGSMKNGAVGSRVHALVGRLFTFTTTQ